MIFETAWITEYRRARYGGGWIYRSSSSSGRGTASAWMVKESEEGE